MRRRAYPQHQFRPESTVDCSAQLAPWSNPSLSPSPSPHYPEQKRIEHAQIESEKPGQQPRGVDAINIDSTKYIPVRLLSGPRHLPVINMKILSAEKCHFQPNDVCLRLDNKDNDWPSLHSLSLTDLKMQMNQR
jgi:hypothetical protein